MANHSVVAKLQVRWREEKDSRPSSELALSLQFFFSEPEDCFLEE
jgi:hypothetical protein